MTSPNLFLGLATPSQARKRWLLPVVSSALCLFGLQNIRAGSATWDATPLTSNWNSKNNWTPTAVPSHPTDTATFHSSMITSVLLSRSITLNGVEFFSDASAFTITIRPAIAMNFTGTGISNSTDFNQIFDLVGSSSRGSATMSFSNSASAGDFDSYLLHFAELSFYGSSTAATSSIDADDASVVLFGDDTSAGAASLNLLPASTSGAEAGKGLFMGNSTADLAILSALGGDKVGSPGATLSFLENSTAANSNVYARGGTRREAGPGIVSFLGDATAENAVILADSGQNGGRPGVIYFKENSSGGAAFIFLIGESVLDISSHAAPGLTLGALDAEGHIFLGGNNLTINSTTYSRTVSGEIQDGGVGGGSGGSLTKVGFGTLTLTGTSTYTGGTLVEDGFLNVANKRNSATGSGSVRVESAGFLVGTGIIGGSLIIGGPNGGGALSPGPTDGEIGKLTVLGALTFEEGGFYYYGLNVDAAKADTLVANGADVTHCNFGFELVGTRPLPIGTVFKIIDNTSASPIIGTFPGYPVGGTLGLPNGNRVQISYDGGDGNDVTLTVVS